MSDAVSASRAYPRHGRYDPAERKRAQRTGRERGCWVYIPAAELVRAGYAPDGPPPYFRVWGASRGGVFVRLYRDDGRQG